MAHLVRLARFRHFVARGVFSNDLRLHFGLGAVDKVDLDIRWPNSGNERISNVPADHLVLVREGAGIIKSEAFQKRPTK